MWKQNLLFAGVCLAGLGALGAWILQSEQFSEPTGFSPQVYKSDDFQQTVDQINKEFHDGWQEASHHVSILIIATLHDRNVDTESKVACYTFNGSGSVCLKR